jgi:hypothetical protein
MPRRVTRPRTPSSSAIVNCTRSRKTKRRSQNHPVPIEGIETRWNSPHGHCSRRRSFDSWQAHPQRCEGRLEFVSRVLAGLRVSVSERTRNQKRKKAPAQKDCSLKPHVRPNPALALSTLASGNQSRPLCVAPDQAQDPADWEARLRKSQGWKRE